LLKSDGNIDLAGKVLAIILQFLTARMGVGADSGGPTCHR